MGCLAERRSKSYVETISAGRCEEDRHAPKQAETVVSSTCDQQDETVLTVGTGDLPAPYSLLWDQPLMFCARSSASFLELSREGSVSEFSTRHRRGIMYQMND